MILGNTGHGNVVASEGTGGTSAVNIANTPHMFNILSSGLYSDKIAAVLRETGCNAVDSHIMSGQPDRPIEVKLPSLLDRTFYVKDWGTGLDDREFRELYTTYGWSNKQQRNDATGAFGLGSKSPFAYTLQNREDADGYTVETVKNGSRRVYTCYISDNGTPQVTLLHEGPADADWPHGLKVTFPVQTSDIDEFHEKAIQVFRWFKVKPILLGSTARLQGPEFRIRGEFYGLSNDTANTSAVVMGGVRYPLRLDRVKGLKPAESAVAMVTTLFLPLGSVMMTPAREELEYTEFTRSSIQNWLSKAVREVALTVRDAVLTPEPTKWAWSRKVLKYYEALPYSLKGSSFVELLKYADVPLDEVGRIGDMVNERVAVMPRWTGDGPNGPDERDSKPYRNPLRTQGDSRGCRVYHYVTEGEADKPKRYEVIGGYSTRKTAKLKENSAPTRFSVPYTANVIVYVGDSTLADARVREQVSETGETALLVMPCKGNNDMEYVRQYARALATCEELEGVGLAATSELPLPSDHEARKALARELRKKTPRELMAHNEVKQLDLATGDISPILLGRIADEDMFFVFGKKLTSKWKATLYNKLDDGHLVSTGGHNFEASAKALREVLQQLGSKCTKVVVLDREPAVNRLKLKEQGFQPLFPYVRELALKADKVRKCLTALPADQRKNETYALGWLGDMMNWLNKPGSVLWAALANCAAARPTLLRVMQENARYGGLSADAERLQRALLALKGGVLAGSGVFDESRLVSAYERCRAFDASTPALDALDRGWVSRNEDASPELVAQVLVAAFEAQAAEAQRQAAAKAAAAQAASVKSSEDTSSVESDDAPTRQALDPLVAALVQQKASCEA